MPTGCVFSCRNLILLYEPEAAAMAIIKQQVPPLPFTEGSTFVVVDAGGGTVDITAHEVFLATCVAEMQPGSLAQHACELAVIYGPQGLLCHKSWKGCRA